MKQQSDESPWNAIAPFFLQVCSRNWSTTAVRECCRRCSTSDWLCGYNLEKPLTRSCWFVLSACLSLCLLAAGPQQQQQQPWLPLSVHLGVPLFCPALCRAVCSNMAQQQCLSQWGQAAWTVAQQQLQHQLADAVGLADSSSSSIVRAHSISSGTAAAVGDVSDPGGPVTSRGSVGGGGVGGGMVGGGVQLPGHCLLFDGHSLLPVDVSSCLQGMQCW